MQVGRRGGRRGRACTRRATAPMLSPPLRTRRLASGHRRRPRPTAASCRRRRGARRWRRAGSGSIRCGAPRSWTQTSTSGQRRTSAPVAPAWSKWMWVSRIARGARRRGPRAACRCEDSGPGSTMTSSRWKQQMTCGLPQVVDVDLHGAADTHGGPYNRSHGAPPARARPPVDDAHLRGPFDRARSPTSSTARNLGQGPDRPVDRLRPARRRPATTPTTSSRAARSARSACRSPTRATCTRCSTGSRSTR